MSITTRLAADRAISPRRINFTPRLALDRASTRTTDQDGHMRVPTSIISAASVDGYLGSEIPRGREMGLDAGRIYQLWRHPDEIAKAAQSLHGKPLMLRHRPQTAQDHARDAVVGSVSNPVWNGSKLRAEIIVWDGEGIRGIANDTLRDLSAGYFYRADMRPGTTPDGIRYDGVMRDLSFNHCALVPDGRVEGAFVGDAAIPTTQKGNRKMADNTDTDDTLLEKVAEFISGKMSPADCRTLMAMLMPDDDAGTPAAMDSRNRVAGAMQRATARRMEAASRGHATYAERFPNGQRLGR